MNNLSILGAILVMGTVTFILRALPFIVGRYFSESPFIQYMKDRFPMIMMLILVIYASNITQMNAIHDIIPALCAIFITLMIHVFFRNFFASIIIGVAMYILLLKYSSMLAIFN